MDPRSMQFAMEQMRRMSPEQLQQLAQQMNHLSPDTIQTAMSQMQNMKPEDWEQAKQKMTTMRPEEISSAASQASVHYQAQQEYIVKASVQLKNEGNRLHQQGQYAEAVEKYEKALSNLAEFKTGPALDVVKACCLNLGSCFLQLGRYHECVDKCNVVLAGDAENLKALYRRGQALLQQRKGSEAVEDLQRAVKLSSHDPNQQSLIKAKLQEAKDLAWQQKIDGEREGVVIEEVEDDQDDASTTPPSNSATTESTTSTASTTTAAPAAASSTSMASTPPMPFPKSLGPGGLDPSMISQAVQMMKTNPDLMKQVEQQMEHLTPDQMADLSAQMGMPVTKDMIASAKERMSNISPDQLEVMAKMAQASRGNMANGIGGANMTPEDMKKMADMVARNPDMMRQANEMLSTMSQEQLAEMARVTGTSPEMAKVAAEQMKAMNPEQLQVMARMASAAGASSSAPARAVAAGASAQLANGSERADSDVSSATVLPDLSNMPPMDSPGDMTITPEMASMVSKMMSDMSPEQMAEMSKVAMNMGSMFQGGAGRTGRCAGGMPHLSPEMMDQLSRPEMMDQVMGMMRSMDKDTLVQMVMSNGMCSSREQAELMAAQMQSMSDSQMKLMVRAASTVQKTMKVAQSTKQYFMRNKLMLAAVIALLLALLLRVFGIM